MPGIKIVRLPSSLLLLTVCLSVALLGGVLERLERQVYGVKPGVRLENIEIGCYLPREVMPILEEIAAREQSFPIEPTINKKGELVAGEVGITVDIEATLKRVLAAGSGEQVQALRIITPPCHQQNELQDLKQKLGQFATWYRGSPGRLSNIKMACSAINFTVLWPGETFSFNKVVGPRTMNEGYHLAPIMLDEELVPGVGGGVCQVATTLYNTARLAGLPIIERNTHSGKVGYVRAGLDAAVAYDYMDLKFNNNRSSPVIIRCSAGEGKVSAAILGR